MAISYFADVCYIGQSYNLEIALDPDDADPAGRLYRDFLEAHDRVYGHSVESPAKIVGVRTVHQAGGSEILDEMRFAASGGPAEIGRRDILVAGDSRFVSATVYDRDALPEGLRLRRPGDRPAGRHDHAGRAGLVVYRGRGRQPDPDTAKGMTRMNAAGERSGLDPITVEVVRHKLEGIANEMQQTLLRSSFSPIVKEGLDASSSLFTIRGETLAQATAIPIHLATLIPIIAKMLEVFPPATMKPGDVYCMNDPYLGGTHLPDIALVQPVFFNDRPIALSATMTHHQDMGGMSPGSIPTNATEIFQEGLRLPPLKFRDAGKYNETLVAIIRQNVRIPDAVMGDLNAQLAACNVGARRMAQLAGELGDNHALAIFDELLDRSEILTRAALQDHSGRHLPLCRLQRQ